MDQDIEHTYEALDPTPKTHIDPHGAEFGIACLYCGRVHRTKTERRDLKGQVVVVQMPAEMKEGIRQLTEEKIFLGQQLQEARKEIWRLQSKIRREAAWREAVCHDEAPP